MKQEELKALVSLLDDEDAEIISHVEKKIISLGGSMIPILETEWESNLNPLVQERIEELIHVLQFDLIQERLINWFSEEEPDLLEGMWIVATYQYPDLEFTKLKQDLEQIYYDAWLEFKPDIHPYDQVKLLNSVIFSKLKFGANTKNFHSPSNSMINIVLESRKGNPISLCVLYMLVARKLKMPVYGVNLPNLFILTYKSENENYSQFYINAFNRGLIFSKDDIDNYIHELRINPEETFYQPCDNRDIVLRALRNLVVSFDKIGDHAKSEEIKTLLESVGDHGHLGI
ncbi:transglutaminase-like domain-containing protein [Fulvivirga maritima]|uniref:transglutaminase-like domain-containing protein n=1 Tax=Fulvivirga maritima TaxID=2904247 RepID=UPI001F2C2B10|nr:transglutaminase-like domain-containing protein [Fulvivirga maritima]UII29261.1 transglutaminase-like domain-containing protein [Fulvivirga maritima]